MTYVPARNSELQDFLGYMVLTCPDFFEPDEDMDLQTAFATLGQGLETVRKQLGEVRFEALVKMADEARQLYEAGDERAGGFRLQDMKDRLSRR